MTDNATCINVSGTTDGEETRLRSRGPCSSVLAHGDTAMTGDGAAPHA